MRKHCLTVRVFCVDRRTLDVALVYSRRNRRECVDKKGEYVGLPLQKMYDTGNPGGFASDLRVHLNVRYEPKRVLFSVEFRVRHDSLLFFFRNKLGFAPVAP